MLKLMGGKSTELSVDIRERIIKSYEENKNISELSRRSLADITTNFHENKEHAFCKKTIEENS